MRKSPKQLEKEKIFDLVRRKINIYDYIKEFVHEAIAYYLNKSYTFYALGAGSLPPGVSEEEAKEKARISVLRSPKYCVYVDIPNERPFQKKSYTEEALSFLQYEIGELIHTYLRKKHIYRKLLGKEREEKIREVGQIVSGFEDELFLTLGKKLGEKYLGRVEKVFYRVERKKKIKGGIYGRSPSVY